MLTRREFLAAGTSVAALAATPSAARAQSPRKQQTVRDAVPPTSPNPVSTRPSDNLGGSTINVGSGAGDLQAAINAAINPDGTHKGNTLVCPAGTTYNVLQFPRTTGNGWTCVRTNSAHLPAAGTRVSPANKTAMFKVHGGEISGTGVSMLIPAGSNGWRFIGMESTWPPSVRFQFGLILILGDRTSFERCYIHGDAMDALVRCFFVRGHDFQIWDSWLSGARYTESDGQAIFTRNNQRMHVENCELQGTGENIMFGDEGSTSPTTDVTFRRNHCFKPLTQRWKLNDGSINPTWDGRVWIIKNHFEIKWAQRVLAEGNLLENNWPQGQDGSAVLVNSGASHSGADGNRPSFDFMFRNNIIRNATSMISQSLMHRISDPPARMAYLNNLALEIWTRWILMNHAARDLWLEHNTVVPMNGTAAIGSVIPSSIFIAWDFPGTDFPRLTLKNNVFGPSLNGIGWQSAAVTNASMDVWIPDRSWAANVQFGRAGTSPLAGVTYYASAGAAGIDTATGGLNAGSPLIRAGSDGGDVGVDFVALDTAQRGALPRGA